jgi:pyrroline-5-carboxylate reductase
VWYNGTGIICVVVIDLITDLDLIDVGITMWASSKSSTTEQLAITKSILGALGEEIYVEEEKYLSMATALSGTGCGHCD